MRPAALLLALCAPAVALAFMTAVPGASLASLSGSAAISRHTHTVRSLRAAGAAPRLRMAGGPAEATETVAPSALVSVTHRSHDAGFFLAHSFAPSLSKQGSPGSDALG